MDDKAKYNLVEKTVFDLPEQPYWVVDSFKELGD